MTAVRLSDQTLRRIGRTLSILGLVSVPTTLILLAQARALDEMITNYTFFDVLIALCYGTLALVLLGPQPRNPLVWLFVMIGFIPALSGTVGATTELIARDQGVSYEEIDTAGWPPGLRSILGQMQALWVISNFGLPTFGLLLAPDGRLPSRRWRPFAVIAALSMIWVWLGFGTKWPLLGGDAIESHTGWQAALGLSAILFLMLAMVASLASLFGRYRRSDAATRRRLRWLLVGGTLVVAFWFAESLGLGGDGQQNNYLLLAFYPALALGFGMAIWRDRLFDVEVIISRTLVYVSLLAVIAGIYVAVVFGVGSLIDQTGDGSPALPVIATVIVAMAFHPARVRLERVANRIVFGRRATPYEVLSDFTQRVAATDDELLADIARLVADGTVATGASVWSLDDGLSTAVSVWPTDAAPARASASGEPMVPGADETYAIEHDGQVIGALGLTLPAAESLPPGDRALIDELTAGIGLALWNRRLTSELRASIEDLRASRRRLVAIQDDTRHRLERDLHDGAQQRLVAAKVRLSIARQMAEKNEATATATALGALCDQADEAIESLRDFARGVYPPLLEAEGLPAALEAQVGRSTLRIALTCDVDGRHGREVEATVYFTVLEALGVLAQADANGAVRVTVAEHGDELRFAIDGPPGVEAPRHVEDRIDAVGGQVRFDQGTATISGSLPTTAREAVMA